MAQFPLVFPVSFAGGPSTVQKSDTDSGSVADSQTILKLLAQVDIATVADSQALITAVSQAEVASGTDSQVTSKITPARPAQSESINLIYPRRRVRTFTEPLAINLQFALYAFAVETHISAKPEAIARLRLRPRAWIADSVSSAESHPLNLSPGFELVDGSHLVASNEFVLPLQPDLQGDATEKLLIGAARKLLVAEYDELIGV